MNGKQPSAKYLLNQNTHNNKVDHLNDSLHSSKEITASMKFKIGSNTCQSESSMKMQQQQQHQLRTPHNEGTPNKNGNGTSIG